MRNGIDQNQWSKWEIKLYWYARIPSLPIWLVNARHYISFFQSIPSVCGVFFVYKYLSKTRICDTNNLYRGANFIAKYFSMGYFVPEVGQALLSIILGALIMLLTILALLFKDEILPMPLSVALHFLVDIVQPLIMPWTAANLSRCHESRNYTMLVLTVISLVMQTASQLVLYYPSCVASGKKAGTLARHSEVVQMVALFGGYFSLMTVLVADYSVRAGIYLQGVIGCLFSMALVKRLLHFEFQVVIVQFLLVAFYIFCGLQNCVRIILIACKVDSLYLFIAMMINICIGILVSPFLINYVTIKSTKLLVSVVPLPYTVDELVADPSLMPFDKSLAFDEHTIWLLRYLLTMKHHDQLVQFCLFLLHISDNYKIRFESMQILSVLDTTPRHVCNLIMGLSHDECPLFHRINLLFMQVRVLSKFIDSPQHESVITELAYGLENVEQQCRAMMDLAAMDFIDNAQIARFASVCRTLEWQIYCARYAYPDSKLIADLSSTFDNEIKGMVDDPLHKTWVDQVQSLRVTSWIPAAVCTVIGVCLVAVCIFIQMWPTTYIGMDTVPDRQMMMRLSSSPWIAFCQRFAESKNQTLHRENALKEYEDSLGQFSRFIMPASKYGTLVKTWGNTYYYLGFNEALIMTSLRSPKTDFDFTFDLLNKTMDDLFGLLGRNQDGLYDVVNDSVRNELIFTTLVSVFLVIDVVVGIVLTNHLRKNEFRFVWMLITSHKGSDFQSAHKFRKVGDAAGQSFVTKPTILCTVAIVVLTAVIVIFNAFDSLEFKKNVRTMEGARLGALRGSIRMKDVSRNIAICIIHQTWSAKGNEIMVAKVDKQMQNVLDKFAHTIHKVGVRRNYYVYIRGVFLGIVVVAMVIIAVYEEQRSISIEKHLKFILMRLPPANLGIFTHPKKSKAKVNTPRYIVRHLTAAVCIVERKSLMIQDYNHAFAALSGKNGDQIIGEDLTDLYIDDQGKNEVLNLLRANGNGVTTVRARLPNNKIVPLRCELFSLDSHNSAIVMIDQSDLEAGFEEVKRQKLQVENLLLKILPRSMAIKLQAENAQLHSKIDSLSIIFIGIPSFITWSKNRPPMEIMEFLDAVCTRFDQIIEKHPALEKIKVINGVYMAAGSMFEEMPPQKHATQAVEFSLDCGQAVKIDLVIGVNTGGPVIAGILGREKPLFDIWGDAVNVSARLETSSEINYLQISQETAALLPPGQFPMREKAGVFLKGKGVTSTFLIPLRPKVAQLT